MDEVNISIGAIGREAAFTIVSLTESLVSMDRDFDIAKGDKLGEITFLITDENSDMPLENYSRQYIQPAVKALLRQMGKEKFSAFVNPPQSLHPNERIISYRGLKLRVSGSHSDSSKKHLIDALVAYSTTTGGKNSESTLEQQ